MARQTIKQINTVKDLEGVKPFEKVELNYSRSILPLDKELPGKSEGFFAGSFEVNKEIYFVISNLKPSTRYGGECFLNSLLYKIQDDEIVSMVHGINGFCKQGESNLEEAVKFHVNKFNEDTLREAYLF